MREITIKAVLNGFVVQAGCQTLVFPTLEELLAALKAYAENPQETEKRFIEASKYGDMKRDYRVNVANAEEMDRQYAARQMAQTIRADRDTGAGCAVERVQEGRPLGLR